MAVRAPPRLPHVADVEPARAHVEALLEQQLVEVARRPDEVVAAARLRARRAVDVGRLAPEVLRAVGAAHPPVELLAAVAARDDGAPEASAYGLQDVLAERLQVLDDGGRRCVVDVQLAGRARVSHFLEREVRREPQRLLEFRDVVVVVHGHFFLNGYN